MIQVFRQTLEALEGKPEPFRREFIQWLREFVREHNSAATLAAILEDVTGLSVIGNPTNAAADASAITAGTDGHVLRRSGTTLGFGQLALGAFADAIITFAKLQNFDALSVLGRSANSAGVGDEIAAGTDGHILRRSGTTLGFGKILTNFITGTSTNDNAAAGDLGEYISASAAYGSIGSWVSNINQDIASVLLPAGDWEVAGSVIWQGGIVISGNGCAAGLTTTSLGEGDGTGDGRAELTIVPNTSHNLVMHTNKRFPLSEESTVYLTARMNFSSGTPAAGGFIGARRAR